MKRNIVSWIVIGIVGAGCGGSGGGDERGKFSGVWSGGANVVESSCPVSGLEYGIYYTHLVNQDGDKIVLDNGATTFEGTAGDRSFHASQRRGYVGTLNGVGNCVEDIQWRYEEIDRDVAQFVVRRSTVSCSSGSDSATCTMTFSGTGYRQGGVNLPLPIEPGIGDGSVLDGGAEPGQPGPVSDTEL